MKKVIPQNLRIGLIQQHKLLKGSYLKEIEKARNETLLIKNYICNDYISITRTLISYKPFNDNKYDPDYVNGIGLLILKKFFNEMNTERDKLRLFFNSSTLLKSLSLENDTEAQLSYLLLVHDFQNWYKNSELFSDRMLEIKNRLQELLDKIQSKYSKPYILNNTRIHSQENFELASNIAYKISGHTKTTENEVFEQRYDKTLTLVNDIQSPVDESNYIIGKKGFINSKKEYMSLFKKQLSYEHQTYFKTYNFLRNSNNKMTAEEVIKNLNWLPKINKSLIECLENIKDSDVSTFFLPYKTNEIAEIIYKEAIRMLSYGQNMIDYTTFENGITREIFKRIQNNLIKDFLKHDDKMYIEVFNKYIDLFLNDNLRRLFRPREYWINICNKLNIYPDISQPFFNTDLWRIKEKISKLFSRILSESCILTNDQLTEIANRHPELGLNVKLIKKLKIFTVKTASVKNKEAIIDDFESTIMTRFISIDTKFLQYLDLYQFKELIFHTGNEMPMLVPPRPYLDYGKCGPLYTSNSTILKDKGLYPDVFLEKQMKMRLKDKYQGRPVWDALNELGCVPWKINKPIFDVMIDIFNNYTYNLENESFLDNLGFPLNPKSIVIPNIKDHIKFKESDNNNKGKLKEFFKLKQLMENKKRKMNSLTYWMLYRLSIANHFKDYILYFPHNMDFRGRVYPISPYLSHMGDDVSRSLLIFANGRKLGPNGLQWLKLHCINLTGFLKKESIEKRLEYAEEILDDKIRDSAKYPLNGSRWWMESEEPWQTLTACVEINNAMMMDDPSEFISYMPVHQDGSCNGLQHYASLGRDKDGGIEVNLLPSKKPADIYSAVAQRVDIKREIDEKSDENSIKEVALLLRKEIPNKLPRKLLKQTIMTTVYGVTEFGAVLQIAKQLRNLRVNDENIAPLAKYLKDQTLASLSEAFATSMALKEWFRKCAGHITGIYKSVEWITPLGLPVYQPYMKTNFIDDDEYQIPIKSKQINAFPPNYVHSLDSTHMMLTALNCTAKNVEFAAVHDCFWTHAGTVEEMNKIIREEFIKLHNEPLIDNLASHFKKTYLYNNSVIVDDVTKSKLIEVFNHKIKKGQLDINEVRNSVHFFS